jgi:glycerate kinase
MMIPQTLLVASTAFDERLDAERVAGAIALDATPGAVSVAAVLEALDFDARMRAARALVLAAARLEEDTLAGSVTFELATRARQAGVPAYAVTGEDRLDSFDARILDLQTVLQARTHRSLRSAGRKLAVLV